MPLVPKMRLLVIIMLALLIMGGIGMPSMVHAAEDPSHDPRFARPDYHQSEPRWTAPLAPSSMWPSAHPMNTTDPNHPDFWSQMRAQGSKWLMDATLSSTSGILMSSISGVAGLASASPTVLFRTPRELTIDLTGGTLGSPYSIAQIITQFALAVMVVILTYRLAGLIAAYDHRSAMHLGVQVAVAVALTLGAWDLCGIMIDVSNRLADDVIRGAFGSAFPTFQTPALTTGTGISLMYSFAAFLHYAALLVLLFQAFRRIIVINLLLAVSPLIGAALLTDGGWNYARVWFFRFVEALATPIIWAISLAVTQALITVWVQIGPGDDLTRAVSGMLLAAFAYLTIAEAPKAVGLAAAESLIAVRGFAATAALAPKLSAWIARMSARR